MKKVLGGFAIGMAVAAAALGGYVAASQPSSPPSAHAQALVGDAVPVGVDVLSLSDLPQGGRGGGDGVIGDDYPYKDLPQDSKLDPWREYVRECTSFVAWRLHSQNHFEMPFYDNAGGWKATAQALGYIVDSNPARGAVAWTGGHVAWVAAVNGDQVTIEEYNRDYTGHYGTRTVPKSAFQYIHFADIPAPAPTPAPQPTPQPLTVTNDPGPNPGLQGSQLPAQGSAPTLQGGTCCAQSGTPTLQGGPTPIQGSTGGSGSGSPAPAPAPTAPPATSPPPAPPRTYPETAGGVAHTWTNYTNAGGTEGPTIAAQQTVQIACKIQGFRVADGNTWWYRIASAPWSGRYYVSADAFYNNGATSGSLLGTPWHDPAVPTC